MKFSERGYELEMNSVPLPNLLLQKACFSASKSDIFSINSQMQLLSQFSSQLKMAFCLMFCCDNINLA